MTDVAELRRQAGAFIDTVDPALRSAGIERREIAMLDHLCYRVASDERYRQLLDDFRGVGSLVGESVVNGRPIATFEFHEPVDHAGWLVPYLELPAPKPGSPYPEGFEHAELVVIGDLDRFAVRHPGAGFDRYGMTKPVNRELSLADKGHPRIKFHEVQLGAVVRWEQAAALS